MQIIMTGSFHLPVEPSSDSGKNWKRVLTDEVVKSPPLLLPQPERGFLLVGVEVELPGHDRAAIEALFSIRDTNLVIISSVKHQQTQ